MVRIFKSQKQINLETFINTRCLVCANSGGGKSYAVRKLLEEVSGKVTCIILDIEGEYKTLREKYDFLQIGHGGDVEIDPAIAKKLPRQILQNEVSTILDISELKHSERVNYVKDFLEALMELPQKLWKPLIVVVEEAHKVCGQQEKQDSVYAVIDLMTRGRKRGYCGILCTQRISKLHKDAAAECNNIMIGRTGLDIDMKRAGEILGFSGRQEILKLRDLEAGQFYVFGPAISRHVEVEQVAEAKTTHPKVGMDLKDLNVKPTKHIQSLIDTIIDLPKKEAKQKQQERDYKAEIADLKRQLAKVGAIQKIPPMQFKIDPEQAAKFKEAIKKLNKIATIVGTNPINFVGTNKSMGTMGTQNVPKSDSSVTDPLRNSNYFVNGGALRMLKAAAMYYPDAITKTQMAAIAGLSYKSGTFTTYLSTLQRQGLAVKFGPQLFRATEEGLNHAGDVPPKPTGDKLVEMWCGIVKGGAARMLRVIAERYPVAVSKEIVAQESGLSKRSGTFTTYVSTLKRNGLIKQEGGYLKLSEDLT